MNEQQWIEYFQKQKQATLARRQTVTNAAPTAAPPPPPPAPVTNVNTRSFPVRAANFVGGGLYNFGRGVAGGIGGGLRAAPTAPLSLLQPDDEQAVMRAAHNVAEGAQNVASDVANAWNSPPARFARDFATQQAQDYAQNRMREYNFLRHTDPRYLMQRYLVDPAIRYELENYRQRTQGNEPQ